MDFDEASHMTLNNDFFDCHAETAAKVFILMPKDVPISRASRLQWFIEHLNKLITASALENLNGSSNKLEILSIVPEDGCKVTNDTKYLVTNSTKIVYVSQTYRFVYCLDMSPSQSAVDIIQGRILFDEVINCFKTSLLGLCSEFMIPCSRVPLQPSIYLTVIINTPFFISPAQQVIVKGVRVSSHNIQEIIKLVQVQFHHLEGKIAEVSAKAYDQIDLQMMENEDMYGGLFDLCENDCIANIQMVSPDANFVNMLRYSMLAIQLLPENSSSHIIVITDGVVAMPDSSILESLLYQLHYDSIAVSFQKVGSQFKPDKSVGYVPYTDLLIFLSHSTLGSILDVFPAHKQESESMNIYQELYLLWSFHTNYQPSCGIIHDNLDEKIHFKTQLDRSPPLLSKRQAEEKVNSSLSLLVSRRMREGYTVNMVSYNNGLLKIKLTLHWKTYIFIHYELTAPWPSPKQHTHLDIIITAPYEFLHDITCIMKKETKSTFRQAVFERFWIRSTQLATNENVLAQQLSSFENSNIWATLPESVRNGIPVFVANTGDIVKISFAPNDPICSKFSQIWQPICYMDTSNWRKWFHTHRLSLILKHDQPLPKHMHLSNSSGRFQVVQCRQAASALYGMLSDWSSFVLVDNHTYVKLLKSGNASNWFCVVRVTSKLPCATIILGFITGTPGQMRYQVCEELKRELTSLSYLSTALKSKEDIGCTLLLKPLEKILIRYERIPTNFHTVIFPDGTKNSVQTLPISPFAGTLFTTLSRYLFHQRWIWRATHLSNERLDVGSLARILGTLTRMRIMEGFNFAHSASGIITMVKELRMNAPHSSCVIQYVLFPPHSAWWMERASSGGGSEEENESDSDSLSQIVTEVWIEPQFGSVISNSSRVSYMDGKRYYELADVIKMMDKRCIHSLLTLEHLIYMCKGKESYESGIPMFSPSPKQTRVFQPDALTNQNYAMDNSDTKYWNPTLVQRIQNVAFNFDPISILSQCQQSELIFSMFIEDKEQLGDNSNKILLNNIHKHVLFYLNDCELELSSEDSTRFTKQVRNKGVSNLSANTSWRCYVKGVSEVHVILTMIPASIDDLKQIQDEDINLPIYVYNCPLAFLVDSHVNCLDTNKIFNKDVFEDHRFKIKVTEEPKLEHENNDEIYNNVRLYCKAVVVAHSRCFAKSVYSALHREAFVDKSDVDAAMGQCVKNSYEIDITHYLKTICSHIKDNKTNESQCCNEMKPVHRLIKEKFLKIISDAFNVIPENEYYYYCQNLNNYGSDSKIADSDDDEEPPSPLYEIHFNDSKSEKPTNISVDEDDEFKYCSPLFLHFICIVKLNNQLVQMPAKILPTCLADLINPIDISDLSKLSVILEMGLLTLPNDNANLNAKNMTRDEQGYSFEYKDLDNLQQVSEVQKIAVQKFQDEIKWLLQDEITTALLDIEPVTSDTLQFVMKHVTESHNIRCSCILEKIDLNFVYKTNESYEKFVQKFCCINITNYKLCQEGDLYYLVKNTNFDDEVQSIDGTSIYKSNDNASDISSIDVDDITLEFDDDIDDEIENYNWLLELNNKRPNLPNFWLITQIEKDVVTVYFHCRFIHLPTIHVRAYVDVQKSILDGVRELCKCVNQSLLLKSLYDTRICNELLEPADNYQDWSEKSQNTFRSTSMDETLDDAELFQATHIESTVKFKVGYFSCPVVWAIPFTLHQRLKTGPNKPGLSIGISALKTVLEKFSVTNRNNMFVYSDSNDDVFYLRLHENSMNSSHRGMHVKSNEFEQPVSRSPSITSLPIGPHRSNLARSDFSISSTTSSDVRPRVQSFGEKDTSKETCSNEDIVTLKVFGITDAKDDIRLQLTQVLQNRLDDAVLELLSIMLSRNAMCPLTPEDVHFLQKPFRPPEHIIKLSIPNHSVQLLDAFIHYLKQNLLQFLNVPKYTDSRLSHFKDYTESDRSNNRMTEENIFIYNQSQNPSSGSRGIACIAMAIIDRPSSSGQHAQSYSLEEATLDFEGSTASTVLTDEDLLPSIYLEFRIWKQGRVNYDILHEKLCAATSHSTWDIIMEYYFLTFELCVEDNLRSDSLRLQSFMDEIHVDVKLDTYLVSLGGQSSKRQKGYLSPQYSNEDMGSKRHSNLYFKPMELGDDGCLRDEYQEKIHDWLEFAIDLKVPAIKKITINLTHPNPLHSTLKEVQTIINMFQQEYVKCFTFENNAYVPYVYSLSTVSIIVISRNFDQWKISTSPAESQHNIPDDIRSQTNKHSQRFMHTFVAEKLIPRQKFLWAIISSRSVELYVYNWAKDNVIKLRSYCEQVNSWLNVRASTLNASCAQKIGLFHNQPIDHSRMPNNPYLNCIGDVEAMKRCPKDKSKKVVPLDNVFLESFRNNYKHLHVDCLDTVAMFTLEMSEIRKANKKHRDDSKKLYSMYQTRTNSSTESQIQLMLQNSRIIHYCHTPILFLTRWRLQSAATRDYNLATPVSRLSTPPEEAEEWHDELYRSFATEYKRYLQTLGFMTLEIDTNSKSSAKVIKSANIDDGGVVYMHKAIILGGILLFSIHLKEPFFITKLYALECNRIQLNARSPINQYIQTFLDECDTIKSSMHLHSFTYDFHLRSIYNYISNNQGYRVCNGYHLIQFLDDFMKYYNKAPNYARNLVHADSMIIGNLLTEGKQLYTYLLSNVKQYNLSVVSMHNIGEGTEYVLIQVSNISDVTYRDAQDRQHTDDFDITLIISNISTTYNNSDNVIHLKYYLILTSGREMYPKTEVERKLGKFRTVSSTSRTAIMESEYAKEMPDDCDSDKKSESDRSELTNLTQSTTDDESGCEHKAKRQSPNIEIKPESVNYLGYYSSHEQLMQQLILNCADNTKKTIKEMVTQGTVDCRTHLLWNKLLTNQDIGQLTFDEFVELKGLSKLESLGDIHPNLGSLINQPLHWFQGLAKLLLYKYHDQHRFYVSEDENIQYYVILHPRCTGAFMLLSIDMHTARGVSSHHA
ncbi:PREDICTED: protein SZT2-like [Nicrophorus vespilloides]|uniref:Protein SZT2-like n=1 Tax=Nicrophorus vespilloides TaxID=110193 RepID=A0ABM1MNI5_NICVS|nr:PREDICTED: protein SZT2-like [Nicrophorus vespilloides]